MQISRAHVRVLPHQQLHQCVPVIQCREKTRVLGKRALGVVDRILDTGMRFIDLARRVVERALNSAVGVVDNSLDAILCERGE